MAFQRAVPPPLHVIVVSPEAETGPGWPSSALARNRIWPRRENGFRSAPRGTILKKQRWRFRALLNVRLLRPELVMVCLQARDQKRGALCNEALASA